MTRFANFCSKLESYGMRVLSTPQEFESDKAIQYECSERHVSRIGVPSFINKTSPKNVAKLKSLCAECNGFLTKKEEVETVLANLGFHLINIRK